MRNALSGSARIVAGLTAILSWMALIGEFYFVVSHARENQFTTAEAIGRFFSYGTMLTNLLVAINMSIIALMPHSKAAKFFSSPFIATGIALYILMVLLCYNILLRQLNNPKGWQELDSELLHVVVPLLYSLYWFFFIPKKGLHWNHAFFWLVGPLLYFTFILLRGAIDGFYPYHFVDVKKEGMTRVLLTSVIAGIAIIAVGLLLIAMARSHTSNKNHRPSSLL